MTEAPPLDPIDAGALISESFAGTSGSRLPKHVRLYDAVAAQIDTGHLTAARKLPGERDLCDATGLSLGTVQKALGMLVTDGRIVREHGRGTFVRGDRRPLTEMWHYRFRDPATGTHLPVYATLAGREHVAAGSPWSDALGPDDAGYVRITRVVSIAGRFRCWSEMHLPFHRFGGLMRLPRADIESINLKQLLAAKFAAPTLATTQTVIIRSFPNDVAEAIGTEPGTPGLLLSITGASRGGVPITFQRIHVPQSDCELEIGVDAVSSITAAAA
jgi:GntR family transcriptional regulator